MFSASIIFYVCRFVLMLLHSVQFTIPITQDIFAPTEPCSDGLSTIISKKAAVGSHNDVPIKRTHDTMAKHQRFPTNVNGNFNGGFLKPCYMPMPVVINCLCLITKKYISSSKCKWNIPNERELIYSFIYVQNIEYPKRANPP